MTISRAVLSKIHIARQQLDMDDDSYRKMLARVAGVRSAKDLNVRTAERVLQELKTLGWKPAPSKRAQGKPHNLEKMPAEAKVVEAQLADMKLPWSYADKIATRMFRIGKFAWLNKPDQVQSVLAALHVEQEKRQLLAEVEHLCQRLSIEHPEQVAGLEQLPKGWKRQRPILKALVDALNAVICTREAG